jgi:hypothetical protein
VSISNIGIDPGVTDQGYTALQTDTITLSNTVAAALSKVGIVSVPASLTAGAAPAATIVGAEPAYITVYDTTSSHALVLGTDYTLSASGSGSQLTYSVLRVSASSNSSNNDTCTVTYLFGDFPDTAYAIGETYAQSQLAYTQTPLGQQFGGYGGQLPGAADTTGTSVAGIGAALPGGSTTDIVPWAGAGQAGGETGTVSQHDYSVLQGLSAQDPPAAYGWAPGSPDTEGVYGGSTSPLNFVPVLGQYTDGDIGSASDPGIIDTTVGGGSLYTAPSTVGDQTVSSPAYRPPILGVAGSFKDTTLTDILGNQVSATPLTDAAYYALDLDTNPWGAYPAGGPPGGWGYAPAAPVGLSSQADAFSAATNAQLLYLSQAGIITSSITGTNTSTTTALVLNTDYSLTIAGNGPDTYVYVTMITGTNFANGNNVSFTYSYGTPQYFDSVAPVSVPAAPAIGASTLNTQTGISFTATPVALNVPGVITTPAALVVTDTTAGANLGNIQVLNVDYTITMSGSGSSLAYSIARLAGSTHSTSGDTVSVAYYTGNAAYFTSGPCLGVNRGAQITWTPPSGTTEIDYYLVQSLPDLGTQWVPKSGLPGFYGEPNVAGSDDYGQPIYQSDTFTSFPASQLAAPSAPTLTPATSGGTMAAGTYHGLVTYVGQTGETLGSAATSVTTTTGASTVTVTSPGAETGAVSYYVYFTQSGGTTYTRQQAAGSPTAIGTSYVISAPPTSTGASPPALNTTVATLSKTAVITPPGQLIVRDTTSSALTIQGSASSDYENLTPTGGTIAMPAEGDPLQPLGQVLIYGVDYTVTQVAVGPWLTYQIQRVAGSVNAFAGDTIVVDYWYNQEGTVPITAAGDTITLSSGSAALLHSGVITAMQNLIIYDTTVSKALAYGLDFTVTPSGLGPMRTLTVNVITTGPAGAGSSDVLHVYYLYGTALATYFTQGLLENTPIIYKPSGATYAWQGYQFQIAAGNRLGLGPFSNASDYVVPLNYQAPQPGFEGTTETITFRDPANTVNPVYLPSGAVLSGTGLGY